MNSFRVRVLTLSGLCVGLLGCGQYTASPTVIRAARSLCPSSSLELVLVCASSVTGATRGKAHVRLADLSE